MHSRLQSLFLGAAVCHSCLHVTVMHSIGVCFSVQFLQQGYCLILTGLMQGQSQRELVCLGVTWLASGPFVCMVIAMLVAA